MSLLLLWVREILFTYKTLLNQNNLILHYDTFAINIFHLGAHLIGIFIIFYVICYVIWFVLN